MITSLQPFARKAENDRNSPCKNTETNIATQEFSITAAKKNPSKKKRKALPETGSEKGHASAPVPVKEGKKSAAAKPKAQSKSNAQNKSNAKSNSPSKSRSKSAAKSGHTRSNADQDSKFKFPGFTFDFSNIFPPAKTLAAAAAGGVILGLACPGFEQWYLAWVGLAPLFLLLASANSGWQRTFIGFVYGMAYNMTYLHWYLGLAPLDWLGFPGLMGNLLASIAWIYVSFMQAYGWALFAFLAGLLPLKGTFAVTRESERMQLPAVLGLPLLWVLVINKLTNAQDLMGVPWTQLEYTQYKQTALLQAASIFGGIGTCALIVAVNVAVACLVATIATLKKKSAFKSLAARSMEAAYYQCLGVGLAVGAFVMIGMWQKDQFKVPATNKVAVVQGGVNIDMQKSEHNYSLDDLIAIYAGLMKQCSDELCVMTEGALPTYLREQPGVLAWLAKEARSKHLDMVVGSMDRETKGRSYNAAYGITSSGTLIDSVYHKRYLVPFGEYTPLLVEYFPEWVKRWTNTPAGGGFGSGKEGVSFPFAEGRVAPLICFECISPEQTARSVRSGGQLLVNVSDLAWFHKSDCGLQMVAFSVLRAIENRRYFVFAANTGPSAIIDTNGKITEYSPHGGKTVMHGRVGFNAALTWFTRLCL